MFLKGHNAGTSRFLTRTFQRNVPDWYLFPLQNYGRPPRLHNFPFHFRCHPLLRHWIESRCWQIFHRLRHRHPSGQRRYVIRYVIRDAVGYISCIVQLVANISTNISGYLISCMTSSTQVALALGPPFIIPLLLFGGFFLRNGSVPVYFDWLRYVSWFMYANEALSINQWQGISFNDTLSPCPNHVCTDEYILKQFDFDPVIWFWLFTYYSLSNFIFFFPLISQINFYRNIGCLFALIAGFRLLAFLVLLKKTYRKNWKVPVRGSRPKEL